MQMQMPRTVELFSVEIATCKLIISCLNLGVFKDAYFFVRKKYLKS
jgi:hypothetical protein